MAMSNSSAEPASETVVVNKHNTIIPAGKHLTLIRMRKANHDHWTVQNATWATKSSWAVNQ